MRSPIPVQVNSMQIFNQNKKAAANAAAFLFQSFMNG